ncbi:MAG: hypothetical protein MUC35_00100 [Candidatus Margulisbacteria bacterium]|jgi:hypothetical protein|nr:hypothetical protein [Candidatus Margulisiibacteriota bacterium]
MPDYERFEQKLEQNLTAGLSAREMAQRFVIAALEAEFGHNFTSSPGFAKMVDTLAEAIVTNPELRRQTLAMASLYTRKKP